MGRVYWFYYKKEGKKVNEITQKIVFENIRKFFFSKDKEYSLFKRKALKNLSNSGKPTIPEEVDNIIFFKPQKNISLLKKFIDEFYPDELKKLLIKEGLVGNNFSSIADTKKYLKNSDLLFEKDEEKFEKLSFISPDALFSSFYRLSLKFEIFGKNIFYVDKNFSKLMKNMKFADITVEKGFFPHYFFLVKLEEEQSKGFMPTEILIEVELLSEDDLEKEKELYEKLVENKTITQFEYTRHLIHIKDSFYKLHITYFFTNEKGKIFKVNSKYIYVKNYKVKDLIDIALKNIYFPFKYLDYTFPEEKNNLNYFYEKIEEKLEILFQVLTYLYLVGKDKKTVYTAPAKLLKRKEYYEKIGKRKEAEKVKKKLQEYSVIHIIGREEGRYYTEELKKAGNPKRPHWRRGHWRIFKHPKFKKAKTYVRPTLIGKKKLNKEELKGHIYAKIKEKNEGNN